MPWRWKPIDRIQGFVDPHGKRAFLAGLHPRASILDVGCGNNSPSQTKAVLPDCQYTGIDIGDYNQTRPNCADVYVVTTPERFAESIAELGCSFDAVISSHNLEHCNDRQATLLAIMKAARPGGRLYLSFPCEQSTGFPRRKGTLNYYDDLSHTGSPPDFRGILATLKENNFEIAVACKNYRPPVLRLIGTLTEPFSMASGKVLYATWARWGFESIIIATKR
jgi:SAM-dependent methyltransferase